MRKTARLAVTHHPVVSSLCSCSPRFACPSHVCPAGLGSISHAHPCRKQAPDYANTHAQSANSTQCEECARYGAFSYRDRLLRLGVLGRRPYSWPPPAATPEAQKAFDERLRFTHQPKGKPPGHDACACAAGRSQALCVVPLACRWHAGVACQSSKKDVADCRDLRAALGLKPGVIFLCTQLHGLRRLQNTLRLDRFGIRCPT